MSLEVLHDKRGDNFEEKAKVLQLSNKDKLNMLNKIYAGKLHFGSPLEEGVILVSKVMGYNPISIQLPEVEGIRYEWSIPTLSNGGTVSIKLPKLCKELILDDIVLTVGSTLQRLFVWDTTYIKQPHRSLGLQIIVLNSKGGKNKIYNV